ncbi:MAG: helix-turn-helix transcriptional regulator [Desulfovibrio sp.]
MKATPEDIQAAAQAMIPVLQPVIAESFRAAGKLEALKRKFSLTPKEVYLLTGISIGTLKNWRSDGRGPEYVKEGTKIVYPVKLLLSWMDRVGRKTVDA